LGAISQVVSNAVDALDADLTLHQQLMSLHNTAMHRRQRRRNHKNETVAANSPRARVVDTNNQTASKDASSTVSAASTTIAHACALSKRESQTGTTYATTAIATIIAMFCV